jgi:hypothetical protein
VVDCRSHQGCFSALARIASPHRPARLVLTRISTLTHTPKPTAYTSLDTFRSLTSPFSQERRRVGPPSHSSLCCCSPPPHFLSRSACRHEHFPSCWRLLPCTSKPYFHTYLYLACSRLEHDPLFFSSTATYATRRLSVLPRRSWVAMSFLQVLAIVLLLAKIWKTKSAAGKHLILCPCI